MNVNRIDSDGGLRKLLHSEDGFPIDLHHASRCEVIAREDHWHARQMIVPEPSTKPRNPSLFLPRMIN